MITMKTFPLPQGIIFDCDSTLSITEGFTELANLKNCRDEVSALTHQAMNGEVPLESVYGKRLEIIRPHKDDLAYIAELYCQKITPGAKETIDRLKENGIRLAIISGGLREAILPLAEMLCIDKEDVFAVDIAFNEDGYYQRVLPNPLTTANGKREVTADWKKKHQLQSVHFVGDGMSDVAALGKDAADVMIGYGGIVARDAVRERASYFHTETDLRTLLKLWGLS